MVFSLNDIKEEIRDTLRAYLYPSCEYGSVEHTLSTASNVIEVAQSFKPYSQIYRNVSPYKATVPVTIKAKKIGSPDGGLKVSIESSSNNMPSGTSIGATTIPASSISSELGAITANIPISSMLGSNKKYWLVITPLCSASTASCYAVAKDSVDTHYLIGTAYEREGSSNWTSLGVDLYFNASIPNWIYTSYPREDLSIHSFPRIAIDIIGRDVNQRWIDHRLSEYALDISIVVYSRFPDELDEIVSYVDRALFKERVNFTNLTRVDPAIVSPVASLRDVLFTRGIRYTAYYIMTNT